MDDDTGLDFFNKAANCAASKIDEYCFRYLCFKCSGGLKLHFITARSEIIEVATINFIQEKTKLIYGKEFTISFRPSTDLLPPHKSKEIRIAAMLQNNKKIALAIDDDDLCLQMYHSKGIPAIKWQNGMLPSKVIEEYGESIGSLLGKKGVITPCQN
ncbi:MAG: hypothetical protein LUG16_03745 [Candidatus Gastranaerophilales bacterium]|nr:hypothetical protein [Candidatus Gastranaerophilales bacterium]